MCPHGSFLAYSGSSSPGSPRSHSAETEIFVSLLPDTIGAARTGGAARQPRSSSYSNLQIEQTRSTFPSEQGLIWVSESRNASTSSGENCSLYSDSSETTWSAAFGNSGNSCNSCNLGWAWLVLESGTGVDGRAIYPWYSVRKLYLAMYWVRISELGLLAFCFTWWGGGGRGGILYLHLSVLVWLETSFWDKNFRIWAFGFLLWMGGNIGLTSLFLWLVGRLWLVAHLLLVGHLSVEHLHGEELDDVSVRKCCGHCLSYFQDRFRSYLESDGCVASLCLETRQIHPVGPKILESVNCLCREQH